MCTKCKAIKPLEEFYGQKYGDGRRSKCKTCEILIVALYRKANPEKIKELHLHYAKVNAEHARKQSFLWRKANPEKFKESTRRWRVANPEKIREYHKRSDKKVIGTPKGRLNKNISRAICHSLQIGNKNNCHWEDLVGFTVDQLKKNIEKKFAAGMSWERYMKGEIHIDHEIPKAAFNFQTPKDIDFKRCWNLNNLQPLWEKDNLSKFTKIERPFQPSLAIGGV